MLFAYARELPILSQHNTIIIRAQRVRKPTTKASIQRLDTPSTVSKACNTGGKRSIGSKESG
jgi:hypothetical protein